MAHSEHLPLQGRHRGDVSGRTRAQEALQRGRLIEILGRADAIVVGAVNVDVALIALRRIQNPPSLKVESGSA